MTRFPMAERAYYFNARWYDPELGRFITEDPARDGDNWYGYCNENPLRFVDPSGLVLETAWDVASLAMGVASFAGNVATGNVGGAVIDAVGIVADAAAVATPFVPGGAGAAIKGIRALNKLDDVVDAVQAANKVDNLVDATRAVDQIDSAGDAVKALNNTDSGKVIENARRRGIRNAQKQERELIQSGHPGTSDEGWSLSERKEIAETGSYPKDVRWHHVNDVKRNPDKASNPDNIIPSRGGTQGHVSKYHPKGTQSGSSGDLLDRQSLIKKQWGKE